MRNTISTSIFLALCTLPNQMDAATISELTNKALDCSAISFILTSVPDVNVSNAMTGRAQFLGQVYALYKSEHGEHLTNGQITGPMQKRAKALGLVWDINKIEVQTLGAECDQWTLDVFKAVKSSSDNPLPALLQIPVIASVPASFDRLNQIKQVVDIAMTGWTEKGRLTSEDVKEMLKRELAK